ncbi:winged helix-turn-helix domain-containing protein [Vibrio ostreicida]|uniref:winged helix-turn-helix domain-containing protein n=1 Tax=Vibrio ostreicida TaxID=526588 RepID=UPI000970EF0F|nr:winged helix-turn-helix domain-containing protein [Vibrio ostreicida]
MNILEQAKIAQCDIAIADLTYSPTDKVLRSNQVDIALEPRNLALLEILLSNVGEPTSIETFIESVWESQHISNNVVTNRISLLRNLFRQHSKQSDPNKIIVTYPKRGYFLSESSVKLKKGSQKTDQQAVKISQFHTKPLVSNRWVWLLVFPLLIACGVLAHHNWIHYQIKQQDSSLFIPQVRLLLDSVNYEEQSLADTALTLKTLLLYSQSRFPYIHLSNQLSPSYYLHSLSEHQHFPGSDAVLDSDYTLNFNLWANTNGTFSLESLLYYSASTRVAWRKVYPMAPTELSTAVNQINGDLREYFELPKTIDQATLSFEETFKPMSPEVLDQVLLRSHSDIDIFFYTRELLFMDVSPEDFTAWLKKVRQQTPVPHTDLHVLLALLTYRSGDIERSLRMLQREYFKEIPDNALVFTLKSNVSRVMGEQQRSMSYHLKALSALTSTLSAQQVLQHYSSSDRQNSCLNLWREALHDIKAIHDSQSVLWQGLEQFCQPYEEQ